MATKRQRIGYSTPNAISSTNSTTKRQRVGYGSYTEEEAKNVILDSHKPLFEAAKELGVSPIPKYEKGSAILQTANGNPTTPAKMVSAEMSDYPKYLSSGIDKKLKENETSRQDLLNYDVDSNQEELRLLESDFAAVKNVESQISKLKGEQEALKLAVAKGSKDASTKLAENQKKIARLESALEDTWNKYGSRDELGNLVYNKKAEITQKKRLQDLLKSNDNAVNDPDFDKYVKNGKEISWQDVGKVAGVSGGTMTQNQYDDLGAAAWALYKRNNPDAKAPMYTDLRKADIFIEQMTDDEFDLLAYYIGKDKETGGNQAETYVELMKETLQTRKGQEIYEQYLKDNTVLEVLYGIPAGLDQFANGVTSLFNFKDDYIPVSSVQVAGSLAREDLADDTIPWYNFKYGEWEDKIFGSSLGQMAYDTVQTTANMAPSIVASTVVGLLNPVAGTVTGATLMGASAAGNAYQEALNNGWGKGEARTYSLLIGASEAVLSATISKVFGGKLVSDAVENAIKGVTNGLARFSLNYGAAFVSEGFEEAAQEVLSPLFENIAFGYNRKGFEDIDWEEVAYSFLLGGLSGGMFETAQSGVKKISSVVSVMKDYNTAEKTQNLLKLALSLPAESKANKLATKYNSQIKGNGKLSVNKVYNLAVATENVLTERLTKSGVKENAPAIASAMLKALTTNQLNENEMALLQESEQGAKLLEEIKVSIEPTQPTTDVTTVSNMEKVETDGGTVNQVEDATFDGVDTPNGKHLDKAQQDKVKEIGKKLGREVVFEDFAKLEKFKGKKKIPDGYIDKNGKVHINYYAKKPVQFLLKHELTHYVGNKIDKLKYADFQNMVFDSEAFKDWMQSKGFASMTELKKDVFDRYSEVKNFNETKAFDEILADFVGDWLFGGENEISQKFIDMLTPKQKKTFMEVIKDIIEHLKQKFKGNVTVETEIDKLENRFVKLYNEAARVDKGKSGSEDSYSFSSIANTFFGDENMTSVDFEKKNYKQTDGYKNYVEQCINNMRQTREDFDEQTARKEIEKQIDGIVKVAIAAKKAGYDILDDAKKRNKTDSKKRLLFSSLEPNSDYFTSSDISTICDKRKNFAEIYDEIVRREEAKGVPKGKRFFDNVDNYFYLHKVLADKGLTQPCRQCYVESMRKNLAPMANAFLRLVNEKNADNKSNDQLYQQRGKGKGNLKTNNAKLRERVLEIFEEHTEYNMSVNDLTVGMLTTADGLAQLKLQAPLIYEAFNSFYGQSKPKMPKEATPFRFGELTALLTDENGNIKQSLVDKINSTGGFRLQSYSDFQLQNFVDVLQVIFEAGTLGLTGHAYTKVPAFLDATDGTNLKRNISIFMYKDGGEWKFDRNDSFAAETLEEIYDIVKSDKSGNTGIIAVSQNKDMSCWIMANDYIAYGIPFHKSGLKMGTVRETDVKTNDGRIVKGYSGTIDHTKQQTEVWAKANADHKALTKVKKGIDIYSFWDFDNKNNLSKNKLIEKNVKEYIKRCEEAGYLPKFRDYVINNGSVLKSVLEYAKKLGFVSQNATIEDISFKYEGKYHTYTIPYGYYKFLGDFSMFTPDGKASPHNVLSLNGYNFNKAVNFFENSEELRRNEILQQFANDGERKIYRDSNLTAEQLEKIVNIKRKQVADEIVSEDSALQSTKKGSIINNGQETVTGDDIDGSTNTELLGGRKISTADRSGNSIRQQSENSEKLRSLLGNVVKKQGGSSKNLRAGESAWLGKERNSESKTTGNNSTGLSEGFYRRLSRINAKNHDTAGRKISDNLVARLNDSIFKTEDGIIISLFHWTPNVFEKFAKGDIGYHLGTLQSAIEHMRDSEDYNGNFFGYMKEMYCCAKKPIFMQDFTGIWTPYDAKQLVEDGYITQEEYNSLVELEGFDDIENSRIDSEASKALRKILAAYGYDVILYKNMHEDTGSISAIVLNADDIIIVADNGVLKANNGVSEADIDADTDSYSIPSTSTPTELLDAYENGDITREEYLEALSKEKTLNPKEIANLTEEDANTTPKLKKQDGVSTGNKESKFYGSVLESGIFNDDFKAEVSTDSFVEKYKSVTNKETLQKAAQELDEGGEAYVRKWMNIKPERASLIDTAVGFILMDRYQRVGDYESAAAVTEKVREFGTAGGQQVQIFSILGRLTPDTMSIYAQRELDKAFEIFVKNKTQSWISKNKDKFKLTNDEIEGIRLRTLQAAMFEDNTRQKAIFLGEIAAIIQSKIPPEKGDSMRAFQRNAMLLNPRTILRNIGGNFGMVPIYIASDLFGTIIDKQISKTTGTRVKGVWMPSSVKEMKRGFYESYDDFKRGIRTKMEDLNRFDITISKGKSFNENGSGFGEKEILKNQLNAVARALNKIDNFTSFCLEAGDRPFFEMWFMNSLNKQMQLNNVDTPTEQMIEVAKQEALERTWQDDNAFTRAVTHIKKGFNALHLPNSNYGFGDFVFKFVKTPSNIAKAIYDFSPAGFISAAANVQKLKNAIETDRFNAQLQREVVRSFSNAITGTLIYTLIAVGASLGLIKLTADDDEDKDVSNFEKYIMGIPPYSIEFFGQSITYDWAQPFGSILAIVAEYEDIKEDNPDMSEWDKVWKMVKAGGSTFAKQSFLKSMEELFSGDDIAEGIASALLSEPAAFVPQLASQTASFFDEYRRTTYDANSSFQTAMNKVIAKIPGLRETLPKQVNSLGEDVKNNQYLNVWDSFMSPWNTYPKSSKEVVKDIYALYKESGDDAVMPRMSPNYFTLKGKRINFTTEEKAKIQRAMGDRSVQMLAVLFDSKEYQKLDDKQKVDVVKKIYDYSWARAKSELEYDFETLTVFMGENKNGDPILTKKQYDRMSESTIQKMVENIFLSNAEVKRLDDYDELVKYWINQAKK